MKELIVELKSIGCSTKQIAFMIYRDSSEEAQKKVYTHISKFGKMIRELRKVAVANFTNESCDLGNFSNPTASASFEPKNRNFHTETETATMGVKT